MRKLLFGSLAGVVSCFICSSRAASLTLGWSPSPSPGIAGYHLYYGTVSEDYSDEIDTGTNVVATVSDLYDGDTYYFNVTAYDDSGVESPPAGEVAVLIAGPLSGLSLATTTVNQGAGPDAVVGALIAADPGALYPNYSLVSGTGSSGNAYFGISGTNLYALNPALMTPGNYSVRVEADNDDGDTLATNLTIEVTADVPPYIVSVTGPASGIYTTGQNLDFAVTFSDPVNVSVSGGAPYLALAFGSSSPEAAYLSGSGTRALTFQYTIQAGDSSPLGVGATALLGIGAGGIVDGFGAAANATFASVSWPGVIVQNVAVQTLPAVVSLANLLQGYDGTPKVVSATTVPAGLALTVTYNGSPSAPIKAGSYQVAANVVDAVYSGSASNTLVVTPAPLTITADNRTRAYGATNPVFTGTVAGLVTNDQLSVTFTSAVTATTFSGNYPITATITDTNGVLPNYNVTVTNGTLTITPYPVSLSIQSTIYPAGWLLTATGEVGRAYEFQISSNLVDWSVWMDATADTSGLLWEFSPAEPVSGGSFFRTLAL